MLRGWPAPRRVEETPLVYAEKELLQLGVVPRALMLAKLPLAVAPFGIGREALVGGTGAARGRCPMLPHLLVVGVGNSRDPGSDERGWRLSGEHSGGGGSPIGEEIGMPSPPHGPPAARSDGHVNSNRGREEHEDAGGSPQNTHG